MATIFFSHFIKFFTHEHPLRTGGGSKVTPGRFSAKIGPARKKIFRQNLRLKKLGIYMEGQRHTVKRKKKRYNKNCSGVTFDPPPVLRGLR